MSESDNTVTPELWPHTEEPPKPDNDRDRVEALQGYFSEEEMLERDEAVDRLASLAAQICDVPMAFINLVGSDVMFHKACFGAVGETTPRRISMCQYTIMQDEIFEIKDTRNHDFFFDNPFVTGDTNMGYYAGVPLQTPDGYKIGTLCLVDQEPNELTKEQRKALKVLADEIISRFELKTVRADLLRLNSVKDEVIKMVGHDMRNPLSGIIGFSEYLMAEVENEEHKEALGIIEEAGKSMLGIVNVLLNSDYIQNEGFKISRKMHDVVGLTNDVIKLHQPFVRIKKQTLDVDMPEACEVKIDGEKWKQIVGNLLGNAIKFTPQEGTVSISVELMDSKKKDHVKLVVQDSGIGMDDETIEKLFSGSKEIRKEGTDGEESTGLGMVMIKKLTELHLGTIEVDSEIGKGSTITVYIPV